MSITLREKYASIAKELCDLYKSRDNLEERIIQLEDELAHVGHMLDFATNFVEKQFESDSVDVYSNAYNQSDLSLEIPREGQKNFQHNNMISIEKIIRDLNNGI